MGSRGGKQGFVVAPHKRRESRAVQKHLTRRTLEKLTLRQRQVLELLAEGHRMREIGELLEISEKTVEYHKYRLMKSHNLQSSADLVRFAVKSGLIKS